LKNPTVLVRPNQAESTNGKNVIIGDSREDKIKRTWGHEIMLKKFVDGQENIKITIKSSRLGGQAKAPVKEKKGDTTATVHGVKQQKNSKADLSNRPSEGGSKIPAHLQTKAIRGWNLEGQ
jgi:hypothetical protein